MLLSRGRGMPWFSSLYQIHISRKGAKVSKFAKMKSPTYILLRAQIHDAEWRLEFKLKLVFID